jgi:iron complex outermembrane recepter protein
MMNHGDRSPGIRLLGILAIVGGLVVLGAPSASMAQLDVDETLVEDDDEVTEEIVVTGSRIRRTEFNTTAPIQIITNERSQLAGLLDATDILQGSTVASGQQVDDSFSGFVVDGGAGANTISLRGLGAQRTLVLVNGKRWGPSGVRGSTNSVDLTAVPTSQIARYEILKDGASSVYGADAVAGVINAITRQRIDGSQLNFQMEAPQDGGNGYSIDGTWGRVGDNWSFNVSGVYGEREETVAADRSFSRCPFRPRPDGSNTRPDGEEFCFGFIHGLQLGPFGFARYEPSLTDPSDTSNPFYDPGIQGFGIPFWTTVPLNDDPNQGPFWIDTRSPSIAQIVPDAELVSVTSFGDLDFTIGDRSATAYYEFYYNRRETDFNFGYRQFFPFVPATNPTNIMGTSGPLAGFGGFGVLSVLPSYELQSPDRHVEVDRTNTFVGLRGDITSSWSYDAYVGHSWSDGSYEDDQWLNDQVNASLDAVLDGSGNLVCSPASLAAFPDCVAGDLFTEDALLRGILPQDYLDFISKRTRGTTEYISTQFAGYVTGPLFELPAGELSAVFGIEARKEEIDDVPDIETQNDNLWGFSGAGITRGDDTVKEAFVELEVPLFTDRALADELTFNGSWRYTDYDSYGGDDTFRVSLNWQFIPSLRFRATKGTSFRAPDLFEQFLANQTGFQNALGNDPCIDYGTNFDPGTAVYQNCASQGLPEDFGTQGAPSIRTVTGGNPDLVAETSDSWTAGVIIQPEWTGTSLAVSWFDIDLKNTVASPTVSFVLSDCYSSQNFSSPFCARVAPRDGQGFLTDVDASLLNVGLQRSKGVDVDLVYERQFSMLDLTIDLTATHIEKQDEELLGTFDEFAGKWGFPKWAAQADVRVDYRDWTFFYNVDWIGSTAEEPVDNRICATGQRTYNSASVRYRGSDWEVIGTVRNLLDRDPPIVSDGCGSQSATRAFNTIPGTGYDLVGRAYVLQVSKSFNF